MTLTLHKSQCTYCSGIMQPLNCRSLDWLLSLQMQIVKVGSELFYYYALLRHKNMASLKVHFKLR